MACFSAFLFIIINFFNTYRTFLMSEHQLLLSLLLCNPAKKIHGLCPIVVQMWHKRMGKQLFGINLQVCMGVSR